MNAHEVLACIELVIYGGVLLPLIFCVVYYITKGQVAWLYLNAFVLAKIAGPAILIYLNEGNSTSTVLPVASQILYQIALGPLLSSTLSFVNTTTETHESRGSLSYFPLVSTESDKSLFLLRLVHPVIICGLVLGIVGGVDRTPDGSTGKINAPNYDRGATFLKVSSVLFIISVVVICISVIRLWGRRKELITVSYFIVKKMVVILPLLFIRVIYSALNSFNLDTTTSQGHTTKYNVMTGSWVIYLFLGLIPQATIVLVYVGCGVLAWIKGRRGDGHQV